MTQNVRWLTKDEEVAWRTLLRAHSDLLGMLDAELLTNHGLSLPDYEVLIHLSEAADRELRMTELARQVLLSPSGLTRRLDGLVKKGYVERRPCPSDGRGLLAVLTREGMSKLEIMAPTHVRGVREHFFDRLGEGQVEQLRAIFERVVDEEKSSPLIIDTTVHPVEATLEPMVPVDSRA